MSLCSLIFATYVPVLFVPSVSGSLTVPSSKRLKYYKDQHFETFIFPTSSKLLKVENNIFKLFKIHHIFGGSLKSSDEGSFWGFFGT